MPKHEQFFKPGEKMPEHLQQMLERYFSPQQFQKLEKFGGRVQISITAPFIDVKKQSRKLEINAEFTERLSIEKDKASELLQSLTKEQLKQVAELLHFPVASKSTTNEIRNQLLSFLRSEDKWKGISGTTENYS